MSRSRTLKKAGLIVMSIAMLVSFACGCNADVTPTQSDSQSVNSKPQLQIEEEIMPALELSKLGGGDDKGNIYSYGMSKLGAIYDEISNYVKENGDYEEFTEWTKTNGEILEERMTKPLNSEELPSLPSVVKKYNIPKETVEDILKKYNSTAQKPEDIYSDEEIKAISEGDVAKAFELMKGEYVVVNNGKVYVPGYIYNCNMETLEKEGIKAEELLSKAAVYETLPLNDEQQKAFQNKILKYAALKADKGELSGEFKISALADYKIDEVIGNAKFTK